MTMTHKTALAVISFGSTFDDTRTRDIGGIEQALAAAFPAYDQYRAFTSGVIRKRLAEKGINVEGPEELLERLADIGYTELILQPTHLLHGEEFEQKILALKEKYQAAFKDIIISTPLITTDDDYKLAAAAAVSVLPELAAGEGVVFMGHGSPRNNNKSFGRTYNRLQKIFDAMGVPALIGTVEDEDSPNFDAVLKELRQRGYHKVHMYPFMVVAGDHANNDMYGDDDDSWRAQIEKLGVKTCGHLQGLGRNKAVQAIYIQHVLAAMANHLHK